MTTNRGEGIRSYSADGRGHLDVDVAEPAAAQAGEGARVIEWATLIDDVVLARITDYAVSQPDAVETVYLTGSYARGSWNPRRPNLNVYFIAAPGRAPRVRAELGRVFADVRRALREQSVDFVIDCHPYTISQRDPAWLDRPLLTLTTKVLAGEASQDRYNISPTIGLGWFAAHKILVGSPEALSVFGRPPARDRAWLNGAHQALSHYRNILITCRGRWTGKRPRNGWLRSRAAMRKKRCGTACMSDSPTRSLKRAGTSRSCMTGRGSAGTSSVTGTERLAVPPAGPSSGSRQLWSRSTAMRRPLSKRGWTRCRSGPWSGKATAAWRAGWEPSPSCSV